MSKCIYCGKDIKNETKIKSVFYEGEYVCKECAWKEDQMWFEQKNINEFPDFSDELNLTLQENEKIL